MRLAPHVRSTMLATAVLLKPGPASSHREHARRVLNIPKVASLRAAKRLTVQRPPALALSTPVRTSASAARRSYRQPVALATTTLASPAQSTRRAMAARSLLAIARLSPRTDRYAILTRRLTPILSMREVAARPHARPAARPRWSAKSKSSRLTVTPAY